jgi:hypothetical protein
MADRERLITDIINRLEILTLKTNILSRELRELREQDRRPARTRRVFDGPAPSTHGTTRHSYRMKPVQSARTPTYEHDFQPGDRHSYRMKPVQSARTPTYEHDFQPGDRVIVTNGTKRGLEGRVFQVARQQVTFRDQTGYTFVRKHRNLRKLNDNTKGKQIDISISTDDFIQAWSKFRESTASSPSGRHYGH